MKNHFRFLLISAALGLAIAGVALKLQNDWLERSLTAQAGSTP